VMVANVLKKYGISNIELKWPNDILFAGRKLAGILLERRESAVVIGIGLNVYLPSDADPNWIAIHDITEKDVARNHLVGLLINELLSQLNVYQSCGLAAFLEGWRQHDSLLNKKVTLQTPEHLFLGVMKGINAQGELMLQDDTTNELRTFSYGEVSCRLHQA